MWVGALYAAGYTFLSWQLTLGWFVRSLIVWRWVTRFRVQAGRNLLMHIHILGVCGTFMAGVALLARAAGHRVSGCDAGVYPPMSTQLAEAGIALREGYARSSSPSSNRIWWWSAM